MTVARRVKLFRNGRSQAVRIPAEFRFGGREVLMHKEGDALVIEPAHSRGDVDALREFLEGGLPDFPARPKLRSQKRRGLESL